MIYAIIPARYDSSRFPGKPLALIDGKSMIQRVYEQASKASLIDEVIVATDDERIEKAVKAFGGNVALTSADHQSGTDRLAEVVRMNKNISIAINVQGDEPLIAPKSIDLAVEPLKTDTSVSMSTLIRKIQFDDELNNPNIVKVVVDKDNYALYFSRSCIPFIRNKIDMDHYVHIGLYGYRRETLLTLSELPQANIEKSESLEQLRALYNGIRIKAMLSPYTPIGVDVPEDIQRVEEQIKKSRRQQVG